MKRRIPVAWFCVRAAVIYAALLAAWPVAREPFAAAYRGGLELAVGHIWPGRIVRFNPAPDSGGNNAGAVEVVIRDRTTSLEARRVSQTWHRAYLPLAILAAVSLATPIPWARRLRALGWGAIGMAGLVALGELFMLLETFTGANDLALFRPGALGRHFIIVGAFVFARSTATVLLLPVLVWVLVTFRRGEWVAFFTPSPPEPASGPSGPGRRR